MIYVDILRDDRERVNYRRVPWKTAFWNIA